VPLPDFPATALTRDELELVAEVETFLRQELSGGGYEPSLTAATTMDPGFSAKLAARGWVGMALPRRFGGGARSAVDRFVVTEQLLRQGAPIGHHWVADRQTGPMLARFGTPIQQERFLPSIVRGETAFAVGISEPDSGSDVSSIRTSALPVAGGWIVNGAKTWTTNAHLSRWLVCLCRTAEGGEPRQGLSQLLVDLDSPGVTIRAIEFLDGHHEFNDVVLQDVFVPDELVLGRVGGGWEQIMSELVLERSSPDRWLSVYLLFEEFVRTMAPTDDRLLDLVGRTCAQWWAIRHLSLSVARMLDHGHLPATQSALVKDVGTRFEQHVVQQLTEVVRQAPSRDAESLLERLLAQASLFAPAFTIRGGTNQILHGILAKGLRA
jgi:3-oxocholest-4-en-26-oyl-CoA dehydrogenase alpha subunit